MLRGWYFPSTAWLVLFTVGLSFVFVYGLAASDHHMAERIPTHLHLVAPGMPVPKHSHGFEQVHEHTHGAAALTGGSSAAAIVDPAPVTAPLESWSSDFAIETAAPSPVHLLAVAMQIVVMRLAHQIILGPPARPPTVQSAST